ncbi:MAG: hypothetical protein A2901_07260 [Elusimicrobia bacterium RIFCSPLOWO2_01_FULL_54_10]|nr:MAG: hypothetical protein A2901_07260 [Elusimicrobia bacterium RIFCSPLOWO2_01_FULL_54_10]
MHKIFFSIWTLGLWSCFAPDSAFAYVDPGMGALLWQLILAGIFGAAFFVDKIRQWFRARWDALCKRFKSSKDVS